MGAAMGASLPRGTWAGGLAAVWRALSLALLAGRVLAADLEARAEPSPEEFAAQADFVKRLNSNFAALQEELRAVRAEQRSLAARLEACGCGAGGSASGAGSSALAEVEEEARPVAAEGEDLDLGAVVKVDVGNTAWLKETLFGGEPWLLHCVDGLSAAPLEQQLPPIFREAAEPLKGLASFGALDCWQRTASGKTLAHRFDFPKPPVAFAVANGDPPALVDLEGLTKPWQLRRKLQGLVQATVARIGDPKGFKSFCTSRRACLVIGFKAAPVLASALKALNPVLERHRGVRAVAVDTSVWKVRLDKGLAAAKPKRKGKQAREQAEMLCIARQQPGSWQGAWLRSTADESPTEEAMGSFLERCAKGTGLLAMGGPPSIAQRPPEQPRAKPPPSPSPASPPTRGGAASSPRKEKGRPAAPSPRPGRAARPSRRPTQARGAGRGRAGARKDHVGSRKTLPEDEPLFSAVEEEEEMGEGSGGEEADGEADGEDGFEEVEL